MEQSLTKVTDIQIRITTETALNAKTNAFQAEGKEYPTPLRDQLIALITANGLGDVMYGFFTCTNLSEVEDLNDLMCCSSLSVRVTDPDETVRALKKLTAGTALENTLEIDVGSSFEDPANDAPYRSVEIYYNVADIPAGYEHYLEFRNEAMELIERALADADAGEWAGAESGANFDTGEPEVNFGFEVEDFDHAEKIIRATVANTPFERIREITRYDSAADISDDVH